MLGNPTYKTKPNQIFNTPLTNIPYKKTPRRNNEQAKNRTYMALTHGHLMRKEDPSSMSNLWENSFHQT